MSEATHSGGGWLKGSLPSWLIAGMLGFTLYASKKWFDNLETDRRTFRDELAKHTLQISGVEKNVEIVESKVGVLERGQDMMLGELRAIRISLEKQPIMRPQQTPIR